MPQGYNARQWNNVMAGAIDTAGGQASTSAANAGQSRNQYMDLLGQGQDALNQSISSAMSSAMPEFRKAMQGVQESEVSRGVGLGGLGTSYEGDLESAFHRNIANAAGSQAMNLFNTKVAGAGQLYGTDTEASQLDQNRYLSALSGQRDYETGLANQQKSRKAGLFGALGGLAGGLIGGPGGAAIGAQIGGAIGS